MFIRVRTVIVRCIAAMQLDVCSLIFAVVETSQTCPSLLPLVVETETVDQPTASESQLSPEEFHQLQPPRRQQQVQLQQSPQQPNGRSRQQQQPAAAAGDDDTKKQRNREAAKKCREKKLQNMARMDEETKVKTRENEDLQTQIKDMEKRLNDVHNALAAHRSMHGQCKLLGQ
jgi:DNA anti-recombination protein RmuC